MGEDEKTTKKTTTENLPELVQPKHGRGALRAGGTPGNKGGGRPPDEFKAAMRKLASSNQVLRHVRSVLNDPSHPQFMAAWKWATERGYGKTPDSLEVSGPGGAPIPNEIIITRRVIGPPDDDA